MYYQNNEITRSSDVLKLADILIIDDMKFMRKILKKILQDAGHKVVGESENGEDGIKLYFNIRPDLVIMDIIMPKKNGIQTTSEILKKDPEAKIIICTALGKENLFIKAINAGAMDFLVKPFHQFKIVERIENLLITKLKIVQ